MGGGTSVLANSNKHKELIGQVDSFLKKREDDGGKSSASSSENLGECLKKYVNFYEGDAGLKYQVLALHNLINELSGRTVKALPLKSTALSFISHGKKATRVDGIVAAGMFMRTELVEPDRPNHSFAMVAAEYDDDVEDDNLQSVIESEFVRVGLKVCELVQLKNRRAQTKHTEQGYDFNLIGIPVFPMEEGNVAVQYRIEEEEEEDIDGSDTTLNARRRKSRAVMNVSGNSKFGAILVFCALAKSAHEVLQHREENLQACENLVREAAGFLRQSVEVEARMEHLYQCQRGLAAMMDVSSIFNQTQDIVEALLGYQEYVRDVLYVHECLVFIYDEARNTLWHRHVDGTAVRLPFDTSSLPGKVAVDRVSVIQYAEVVDYSEEEECREKRLRTRSTMFNLLAKGDKNTSMLAVPIIGEKGVLGAVLAIEKTVQNQFEWSRIQNRSRAGPLPHNAGIPTSTSTAAAASSNGFVSCLDTTAQNNVDESWNRTHTEHPKDTPVYFTDYDTALLENTIEELSQLIEYKLLDLTYLMQVSHNDAEKDDDHLHSLLAMYNPQKRRNSQRTSLLNTGRKQSFRIGSSMKGMPLGEENAKVLFVQDNEIGEEELFSWDFDVLNENDEMLVHRGVLIFQKFDLLGPFSIDTQTLNTFLNEVRTNYLPNPYHNWAHGYSVLHTAAIMLRHGGVELLKSSDVLALLIAAVCHDVGHPGTNNDFQINSSSPLALLYNDASVLENFHASRTFQILQKDQCNILHSLNGQARSNTRQTIIQAILSTDISKHFKLVADLKSRHQTAMKKLAVVADDTSGERKHSAESHMMGTTTLNAKRRPGSIGEVTTTEVGTRRETASPDPGSFRQNRRSRISKVRRMSLSPHSPNPGGSVACEKSPLTVRACDIFSREDRGDRLLVVETIIHTSDLSNPVLSFDLYRQWSQLVVEEFYKQALQEKALGLPSQPLMKKSPENTLALAGLQMNFIDYVVCPLWEIVRDLFPSLSSRHDQLVQNRSTWKKIREELEAEECETVKAGGGEEETKEDT